MYECQPNGFPPEESMHRPGSRGGATTAGGGGAADLCARAVFFVFEKSMAISSASSSIALNEDSCAFKSRHSFFDSSKAAVTSAVYTWAKRHNLSSPMHNQIFPRTSLLCQPPPNPVLRAYGDSPLPALYQAVSSGQQAGPRDLIS